MRYIIILISALLLYGCGTVVQRSDVDLTQQIVVEEAANTDMQTFVMTAEKYKFTPSTITVNEGDLVELTISSTDVEHGFSLPDFGVKEDLPVGKAVTVIFTADKKGTFEFRCSVLCGSGHGDMKGTLIVQ
ncbi:cupredoxin domain-containing protein [Patescibacteria group bacterium]|nr:cupredoxin domain-containing protein [Patescibacteria group bacterium]